MILVDSNVFIDYWRTPWDEATDIFLHNEIAICGVIKTELLRGSKTEKQFDEINIALNCFEYLNFTETDWKSLAELFVLLKYSGISVPFQDGIIAYLAMKNSCELWTRDKHFKLIQNVKPELKLR